MGAPFKDVDEVVDAGAVYVFYGKESKKLAKNNYTTHQYKTTKNYSSLEKTWHKTIVETVTEHTYLFESPYELHYLDGPKGFAIYGAAEGDKIGHAIAGVGKNCGREFCNFVRESVRLHAL